MSACDSISALLDAGVRDGMENPSAASLLFCLPASESAKKDRDIQMMAVWPNSGYSEWLGKPAALSANPQSDCAARLPC